jgi:hypothetical protein
MKPLLLLLLLSLAVPCFAGTYTAASCNYNDVNACVNSGSGTCSPATHTAVNGDTINIPSGSCSWANTLTISNICIYLLGSGSPNSGSGTTGPGTINTTITDTLNNGSPIIEFTGIPESGCGTFSQYARVSTLIISPGGSVTAGIGPISAIGVCTSGGCPYIRVDNINFSGWTQGNGSAVAWMVRTDGLFGVMDHNSITSSDGLMLLGNSVLSAYLGVGSYGDNSWNQPLTLGTASAMYFENNSLTAFATQDCDQAPATEGLTGIGGCRDVVRYNTLVSYTNSVAYYHGTDTTQRPRGGLQIEIYGNTATCTNATQGCSQSIMDFRSGTGVIFGNSISVSGGAFIGNFVALDTQRRWRDITTPWGLCNGSSPYDTNDGTIYVSSTYTGTTGSTTLTDSTQTWTTNQWVDSGDPYAMLDVTQDGGTLAEAPTLEIGSNTATTATPETDGGTWSWTNGDSYRIQRASVCVDQPGRSLSISYSGSTPSPSSPANETLTPIYEWDDAGTTLHGNFGSATQALIANRDYYTDNQSGQQTSSSSPFNGTTGVGWGTLARRPTTCTKGVGYAEYASGAFVQLDICTATNTWTSAEYATYTYPHPLDGGMSLAPAPWLFAEVIP